MLQKFIKWVLSQAISLYIKYKWTAILTLLSGVVMCVITFLRDIDIAYSIPIIIFVIGAIPWTILGCIKLYEYLKSRPKIEIIYDKSKNGLDKVLVYENKKHGIKDYENHYAYRIVIKNITNKTLSKIQVFVENIESSESSRAFFSSYGNQQRTYICDINPYSSKIVTIAYYDGNINDLPQNYKFLVNCNAEEMIEVKKEITL